MFGLKKRGLPSAAEALPGRQERMPVPETHFVTGARLEPPFPAGTERAVFGMGCFWGAEKKFWQQPGVYSTAVGYAAGPTPNPTYREEQQFDEGKTRPVEDLSSTGPAHHVRAGLFVPGGTGIHLFDTDSGNRLPD